MILVETYVKLEANQTLLIGPKLSRFYIYTVCVSYAVCHIVPVTSGVQFLSIWNTNFFIASNGFSVDTYCTYQDVYLKQNNTWLELKLSCPLLVTNTIPLYIDKYCIFVIDVLSHRR